MGKDISKTDSKIIWKQVEYFSAYYTGQEGSSRKTAKDQAHFTTISYGSLMEMLNQLIISSDLEYITFEELIQIRPKIEKIGNKLNSLRNSQLSRFQFICLFVYLFIRCQGTQY